MESFWLVTVIIKKGCLKLRDLDKLVEAGSHNLVQILFKSSDLVYK